MMPQTVPNNPMNGVTAAVMASQGTLRSRRVIFFGGSDLHAALHGGEAAQSGTGSGELALVFLVAAFENSDQRAGTELIGNGGEILHALGFAKGAQEASTLDAGAAQQAPLGKNDGPGDEAESQQGDQDELGDRTGAGNQVENFAADEKAEYGSSCIFWRIPCRDYR
jgi:hypothetical protein